MFVRSLCLGIQLAHFLYRFLPISSYCVSLLALVASTDHQSVPFCPKIFNLSETVFYLCRSLSTSIEGINYEAVVFYWKEVPLNTEITFYDGMASLPQQKPVTSQISIHLHLRYSSKFSRSKAAVSPLFFIVGVRE